MYTLKPISRDNIPSAISKAEHYRLLNEPAQAESICRDVLSLEPENQRALICLTLALSDQISQEANAWSDALSVAGRLTSPYEHAYYSGIVWERRAKARYLAGDRPSTQSVYTWVAKALDWFGKAEAVRPAGNDDALLRWNACVRFLSRHPQLQPSEEERTEAILSE